MSEPAHPGRFLVFEGGEGSGKTTVAAAVAARLRGVGRDVVHVREPGDTPAGEHVRELLHDHLAPWAEAFAFLLARAQLVQDVVRPALQRGATVVCDRFTASTLAYQGYGRGLDLALLREANAAATSGLHPDLTVFLDIDPELGLQRKLGEERAIRTGLEVLDFHRRVHAGYKALMAQAPPRSWFHVDATLPPSQVESLVWDRLQQR